METPVQCFHASIAAVLPVVMLPPWAGMARAQLSKRTPTEASQEKRFPGEPGAALSGARPDRAGVVEVAGRDQHHDARLAHDPGVLAVSGRPDDLRRQLQSPHDPREPGVRDQPADDGVDRYRGRDRQHFGGRDRQLASSASRRKTRARSIRRSSANAMPASNAAFTTMRWSTSTISSSSRW